MRLADFDFDLPEESIATYPSAKRDESRMLYYNRSRKKIEHSQFKNIVEILQEGDILVRNNSKVLPVKFELEVSTGSKLEILLLEKSEKTFVWKAIAGNAKRIKAGRTYTLANGLEIDLRRFGDTNEVMVDFGSLENYLRAINECGSMPIPPYMKREAEEIDKERYQTIYAKESDDGASIAAPTAGLHFTDEIDQALLTKGIEILELSLHVGLGTFLPVKTENITEHKMHSEYFSIDSATWSKILQAKTESRRVIAIGSTSARVLETVANTNKLAGSTDIFIYPGYEFKIIDGILTNFHLPKSSLIMMIAAFLGLEQTKEIYAEAIAQKYRFYSYGDCCLFL